MSTTTIAIVETGQEAGTGRWTRATRLGTGAVSNEGARLVVDPRGATYRLREREPAGRIPPVASTEANAAARRI